MLPVRPVGLGQHVGGGPLVDVDVPGDLGDLGHELDGAGPGADHGHAPARQVDVVVPACRMPPRAVELVPAGDVGKSGTPELADRADDRGRLQRAAIVEGEVPDPEALVELGRRDPAAEAQMRAEAALGDQPVQVGQDLLARREAPAPAPGPERVRVQLRRHVAAQARVAVVAPGPAEVVRLVQHDEVLDARLLERDRHADPAESGSYDDHPVRHEPSLALRLAVVRARSHEPGTGSITRVISPEQRRPLQPVNLAVSASALAAPSYKGNAMGGAG